MNQQNQQGRPVWFRFSSSENPRDYYTQHPLTNPREDYRALRSREGRNYSEGSVVFGLVCLSETWELALPVSADEELFCQVGELILEHGPAAMGFLRYIGLADALDEAEQCGGLGGVFSARYLGTFSEPAEWAEQWLGDSGKLNDIHPDVLSYINFRKVAEDRRRGGYVFFVEDSDKLGRTVVHVFERL